jgi:hypothetical protein
MKRSLTEMKEKGLNVELSPWESKIFKIPKN